MVMMLRWLAQGYNGGIGHYIVDSWITNVRIAYNNNLSVPLHRPLIPLTPLSTTEIPAGRARDDLEPYKG